MTLFSSKMIVDSISEVGMRLTTFEVSYPSTYHAEVLSNRELSVTAAGGNVRKPMSETRAVVTATHHAFEEFFAKYQPATSVNTTLAELTAQMRGQLRNSPPTVRNVGEWHLPYIDFHTVEDACLIAFEDAPKLGLTPEQLDLAVTAICRKLSVVRCHHAALLAPPFPATRARHADRMAFYNEHLQQYLALENRLLRYGSAFEHQAQPDFYAAAGTWNAAQYHGNTPGWQQNRTMFIEPMLVNQLPAFSTQEQVYG